MLPNRGPRVPGLPQTHRDGAPTGYPARSNSGVTRLGGGPVLVPHSRHPRRAAASPSLTTRDETRRHSRRYLRQDELSDELRATLGVDLPSPSLQRSSRLDTSQAQTGESRVPRLPEAATKERTRKSRPCPPGPLATFSPLLSSPGPRSSSFSSLTSEGSPSPPPPYKHRESRAASREVTTDR